MAIELARLKMNEPSQFIVQVAKTGKKHTGVPALNMCDPIAHFFLPNGKLDYSKLDKRDGSCTRRELLARILLLYAVVSQFDDNYHLSSNEATKALYLREIRFLHRPIEFYQSQGIIIDEVLEKHRNFGFLKPENWGSPYTENRFIDKTSHALNSGTSFWKVPLALPLLLERDSTEKRNNTTALIDFLEFWSSTEEMCLQLKAHPRYGLGKAIGDKACHLFAKWMVSVFV